MTSFLITTGTLLVLAGPFYYFRFPIIYFVFNIPEGLIFYDLHTIIKRNKKNGQQNASQLLCEYFRKIPIPSYTDIKRIQSHSDALIFWQTIFYKFPYELIVSLSNNNFPYQDIAYFKKVLYSFDPTKTGCSLSLSKESNLVQNPYTNDLISEEDYIILQRCLRRAIVYSNSPRKKFMALLIGNMLFNTDLLIPQEDVMEVRSKQLEKILNEHPYVKIISSQNIQLPVGWQIMYLRENENLKIEASDKKILKELKRYFIGIGFNNAVNILKDELGEN